MSPTLPLSPSLTTFFSFFKSPKQVSKLKKRCQRGLLHLILCRLCHNVARGFDKNRKACETWKKKGIRVDRCSKKYSNTFPSPLTRAFEKSNMHPSAILISVLSLAALAAVTTAQFTLFPASTSAVTEVTRADQAAFTSTGLSDAPYKLVLYYSAQCPHCQAFAPQYEVTAKTFASSCPDLDFQVRFLRYFVCLVSPSSPALLFRSTFFCFFPSKELTHETTRDVYKVGGVHPGGHSTLH